MCLSRSLLRTGSIEKLVGSFLDFVYLRTLGLVQLRRLSTYLETFLLRSKD